ncbi:MAG TPA: 16S rRNA (cytidine(1402)-2'-O)-methyltransferase, partial [Phenylobacterium sp.]
MARALPTPVLDDAPLAPGLYVVATPIGNLRDITLRALDVLAACDMVLAEDTRVTGKLLHAFGISAKLERHDEHAAERARPKALAALAAGRRVALVSDAGTPLISDPGYRLVREAAAAGHAVFPIPGASALLAGLSAAGLPTDRFLFVGFPPPKSAARRTFLAEFAGVRATLVFFEGGSRLADSLADMAAVLGDREAVVCRELTKLYETFYRGPLATL